ncbi:PP2C family serine/threonine-protein phosphatase [Rathayibacter sp. AY1D2]|uniref:PP2C family serine/threonine-protein phosphatase n=1 Tax=Rathayibacter sp. AY1D2 TaxID=2080543 RepID=UPI0035BE7CCB
MTRTSPTRPSRSPFPRRRAGRCCRGVRIRFRGPRWAAPRRKRPGSLGLDAARVPPLGLNRTWRVTAASVPGTSHVESGRGCDDAFAYEVAPDGRGVVIAVADGAGSRSGTSALGSFAACRAVVAEASALIVAATSEISAEPALRRCFAAARAAVESYAGEHGLQTRDLATTLAVAVITPGSAVVAQIGDGIIVFDLNSGFESLIPEEKGEYANEVVFLTSPRELDSHVRTRFFDNLVPRVAMSTDGLRYKILRLHEGGIPFDPFFEAVWQAVADGSLSAAALSDWLTSLDDQTGDDLTLVAAALVEAPLSESMFPASLASQAPPTPSVPPVPPSSSAVPVPPAPPLPPVHAMAVPGSESAP